MSPGIVVQGPSHALKLCGGIFLLPGWNLNLNRCSMVSSRQRSGWPGEPCAFAAELEMFKALLRAWASYSNSLLTSYITNKK